VKKSTNIFMFWQLKKRLSQITSGVAIDAGSSDMVTTNFFRTDVYYRLDMQKDRLEIGLKQSGLRSGSYGLIADIADLSPLPDNCADVVVCTNVLFWVEEINQRLDAIAGLARISRGELILTLRMDKDFDASPDVIADRFSDVKVVYYRHGFIRRYDALLHTANHFLGGWVRNLAGVLRLAEIANLAEYLTVNRRKGCQRVLVVAKDKISAGTSGSINLSTLKEASPGVYDLAGRELPTGVVRADLK